jgi:hypothetical protein
VQERKRYILVSEREAHERIARRFSKQGGATVHSSQRERGRGHGATEIRRARAPPLTRSRSAVITAGLLAPIFGRYKPFLGCENKAFVPVLDVTHPTPATRDAAGPGGRSGGEACFLLGFLDRCGSVRFPRLNTSGGMAMGGPRRTGFNWPDDYTTARLSIWQVRDRDREEPRIVLSPA